MEKKNTKKKTNKKTTSTKRKVTNKTVKPVKKEVKNEEVLKVEETKTRNVKDLIYGSLYLICSIVWVLIGVNKAVVKERFIFDIFVSILLFTIAVVYFIVYFKKKK